MTVPRWLRPSVWHLAFLGVATLGGIYAQLQVDPLPAEADDPMNTARVARFDPAALNTPIASTEVAATTDLDQIEMR
jgi:hypothetical protein